MTLIVGFNFGSYVLMGADARVCYYPNDRLVFRDDEEKIRETSMGLIAGAGLANLLDAVKVRLKDEDVTHTDRIIEIVNEERRIIERRPEALSARVQEALTTTAWMFTYYGTGEATGEASPGIHLRLAFTDPSEGYMPAFILPGQSWMMPPTGTTEEQFAEWRRLCLEHTHPLAEGEDFVQHLAHHSRLIANLVSEVAKVNDGVCSHFQLGLHRLDRIIGHSSIVGDDYEHTWELRIWGAEASAS